jgi:hypothetical protein
MRGKLQKNKMHSSYQKAFKNWNRYIASAGVVNILLLVPFNRGSSDATE